MTYLSVDTLGYEYIHNTRPTRKVEYCPNGIRWENHIGQHIGIPKGTIKQLIGREITFENGPSSLRTNRIY